MDGNGNKQPLVEVDISVKTDEFEGPLGLLLTLITKNKLDITRVSLTKIVDQYIEYSRNNKPELVTSAEFVRIASILLYLKATTLLAKPVPKDEDMEAETEVLLSQLEIIKEFRVLRDLLKNKRAIRQMMLSKQVKRSIIKHKDYTLQDLVRLAVKYFINIQRDRKYQLKRDEVNISEKIDQIKKILNSRYSFSFSELVMSEPVLQQITSFIAILETTRSEITKLQQEKHFDDILVLKR
ncbi:MAG: segregation/condensation protein A [Spirochaetia bacterium]|nr:segregation/condensation protein A [Spirochaetota bacterium]MCX8097360.1 segregation/condensation protein A [Spirochaetota bacterium]MDW8112001.1 segregation/condensation protein A [Spirochaetia bacterium]